jgi:integrase
MTQTKAPELSPKFDATRKRWRLSVPAKYSPSNTRQRLFFDTKRAATMEAERLRANAERWGTEARQISASLAEDATRAAAMLAPHGLTLIEAAKACIDNIERLSKSVTFAQLWAEHLETKEGCTAKYLKDIEHIGAPLLEALGEKYVCEIEPIEIEKAMASKFKTPSYFNLCYRTARPAFSLAVRRGYLDVNPFDRIEKRKTPPKEIQILSVAEMKRVLNCCADHRQNEALHPCFRVDCRTATPAIAIMAFAGVRPAETAKLEWADINMEERTIRIRGKHAKTRSARIIDMEDNLHAWLDTVPRPERVGSVTGANWPKRYKAVRKASGISDRNDVLRHSFASYHLAAFADVNRTRAAMGHELGDVLFQNYRAVVSKRDAVKYWSITPDGTGATLRAAS